MDLTKLAIEVVKGLFKLHKSAGNDRSPQDIQNDLMFHLVEVENWSRQIQFFGLATGEDLQDKAVTLALDTIPRKFRGTAVTSAKISDLSLLSDRENYLLLGDPGSGKTTTIKRLARQVLLGTPVSDSDPWQYPVVVRLKTTRTDRSIFQVIAESLGIAYEERTYAAKGGAPEHPIRVAELFVGTERLDHFVPKMLDATGAVVLIDGLDEVPLGDRQALEQSIANLALRMAKSKVILSSRSGDHLAYLDTFQEREICPLEAPQIEEIASRWLDDPGAFLTPVAASPFYDLASRPLFLCQLIVFYRNTGYLPDQPKDVYRKIIRLLLEEWDQRRQVRRQSRYSRFEPETKLEFLAALSYNLTYRIRTKRFDHELLVQIYEDIREEFDLESRQAIEVAREIQTHTGLIIESSSEFFEFSHLSLQEYLCAYYLVREPLAEHLIDYLRVYPAPVAIASVLAAKTSLWVANLLLNRRTSLEIRARSMNDFLTRLLQEKPRFSRSPYLGFAVIRLVFDYWPDLEQSIRDVVEYPKVGDSLSLAFEWFTVEPFETGADRAQLRWKSGFFNSEGLLLPTSGGYWPLTLGVPQELLARRKPG